MKVAIASGKGGTGKTTVAANLAWMASRGGQSTAYLDCDVEEPNGHIFLKPDTTARRPVDRLIPQVAHDQCTGCGACGQICQFSAIVCMGEKVLVFPALCHSCGGCSLVCPTKAITETPREIGQLASGTAGAVAFVQGELNIGEAMSPPVIKAVKAAAPEADLVLVDAPPGTSCAAVESIRDADYVVLVTEPTPFGLNDLELAVDMVRALDLPFGVVINRADVGDDRVGVYCHENEIPILAQIADDRRAAEAYSRGEILCEALPDYAGIFTALLDTLLDQTGVPAAHEHSPEQETACT
jgi:MinD superfamily P-loop ATPase